MILRGFFVLAAASEIEHGLLKKLQTIHSETFIAIDYYVAPRRA